MGCVVPALNFFPANSCVALVLTYLAAFLVNEFCVSGCPLLLPSGITQDVFHAAIASDQKQRMAWVVQLVFRNLTSFRSTHLF